MCSVICMELQNFCLSLYFRNMSSREFLATVFSEVSVVDFEYDMSELIDL